MTRNWDFVFLLVFQHQDPAIGDLDILQGSIEFVGLQVLNFADDFFARNHVAKDHVQSIQMRRRFGGDEELRSIGVGSAIGHGQEEWSIVLDFQVFIGERLSVDGFAAGSIVIDKVSALQHESLDDAMKNRASIMQRSLRFGRQTRFTRAQTLEIAGRFGHDIVEQLKHDPTGFNGTNRDIEKASRVIRIHGILFLLLGLLPVGTAFGTRGGIPRSAGRARGSDVGRDRGGLRQGGRNLAAVFAAFGLRGHDRFVGVEGKRHNTL